MRISDWSSDVCSSDLEDHSPVGFSAEALGRGEEEVGSRLAFQAKPSSVVAVDADVEQAGDAGGLQHGAGVPARGHEGRLDAAVAKPPDRKSTRLNSRH